VDDRTTRRRLLHQLGQVYYRAGNYKQAMRAHQDELTLLQRLPANDQVKAETYFAFSLACDRGGEYEEALKALEQGLKALGPEPTLLLRAKLLRVRCSVQMNRKQLPEATQDGQDAVQIAQALGDRYEEAYACNNLGAALGTEHKYADALEWHRRSLAIRRELMIKYEIAQSLDNVANALAALGQFQEVATLYQEALDIRENIGDLRGLGSVYHNLAWLEKDQERYDKAEDYFLEALSYWREIDYPKGIAFVHNDLGTLCLDLGRLDEAREHLEESAQRYEEMKATTYLSDNYLALAQVYLQLKQFSTAESAAHNALALLSGKPLKQAEAYDILSQIYHAMGDPEREKLYTQLARAEREKSQRVQ